MYYFEFENYICSLRALPLYVCTGYFSESDATSEYPVSNSRSRFVGINECASKVAIQGSDGCSLVQNMTKLL